MFMKTPKRFIRVAILILISISFSGYSQITDQGVARLVNDPKEKEKRWKPECE